MLSIGTQTEETNMTSTETSTANPVSPHPYTVTDETPGTVVTEATDPIPTSIPTSIDPVRVLCAIEIDADIEIYAIECIKGRYLK